MKWNIFGSILITGIVGFIFGWFSHGQRVVPNVVLPDSKPVDSSQKTNSLFLTIKQTDYDSLKVSANINSKTVNFSNKLNGRFVMKDAKYAGYNFISPTLVIWVNENDYWHPDTFRIRWLDNVTFYTQDIIRYNENCPPRVWIHQVVSFDGKNLILKDIWTGWGFIIKGNNVVDERTEYIKREPVD